MKKILLIAVISSVLATSAYAGVKDKKAMRSVNEDITSELKKVKSHCGNPALEVKVSWDKFKTMIKANKDALAARNYKGEWVISQTGERATAALEAFTKICKEDADYREEIAAITQIIIEPKPKFKDTESSMTMKDTVLTIESGHHMSRNLFDFIKPIKSLF